MFQEGRLYMVKQYENIYFRRFLYFNTYVIKGEDGDILIDTGFIGMKRKMKRWLDNFDIKLVILTHPHVDHIWNAAYIKNRYNCKIAMSEADVENIDNRKLSSVPSQKKYKYWTKLMHWGMKKFVADSFDVDMYLNDEQLIDAYGINLKIISLKGHTEGSIGILYNDYLFAGDSLVNRKKHPSIAYQNQNNEAAIKSYEKIVELNPKVIFVGHDKEIKCYN